MNNFSQSTRARARAWRDRLKDVRRTCSLCRRSIFARKIITYAIRPHQSLVRERARERGFAQMRQSLRESRLRQQQKGHAPGPERTAHGISAADDKTVGVRRGR